MLPPSTWRQFRAAALRAASLAARTMALTTTLLVSTVAAQPSAEPRAETTGGAVISPTAIEPDHQTVDDSLASIDDPEPSDEPREPADVVGKQPTGSSLDYTWRRGDTVLDVNTGAVVERPHTSGMPAESVRTSFRLQFNVGAALFTCPQNSPECQVDPGVTVAVAVLQRPVVWFSWGGSLEAQQFGQTWRQDHEVWSLEQRVVSARLLAQVHIPDLGRVDPYIGIGLGGGAVHDVSHANGSNASTQWLGTPLYSARAGLTYRVAEGVELGALVDWTNMRVYTGESCPWAIGGICSSNNWAAFSPQNALWNATATVSFAFGQRL